MTSSSGDIIPIHEEVVSLEKLLSVGLVPHGKKRSRLTEEIRLVVNRLVRLIQDDIELVDHNKVVMVTSAKPAEGKSYSALNIAAGVARYEKMPTILVDADAKAESLTYLSGLGQARGLLDLNNVSDLDPRQLLVRTAIPNLFILPIGSDSIVEDETREHVGRSIAMAIDRVCAAFPDSYIIIDTAPCLSTSDPSTIAQRVGSTVFVIQAEETQKEEVEASLALIDRCKNICIILNKARLSGKSSFGSYEYYN